MPLTQAPGINPGSLLAAPGERRAVVTTRLQGSGVVHQAVFPGVGEAFKGRPVPTPSSPSHLRARQAGGGYSYTQGWRRS